MNNKKIGVPAKLQLTRDQRTLCNNNSVKSHQERQDAEMLLQQISADLPYTEWFRVAAALKGCGVNFSVFDEWSATTPERYDAEVAQKTWNRAAAEGKERVGIGTLKMLTGQFPKSQPASPAEMLPVPQGKEAMATQAITFMEKMFMPGEYFELVIQSLCQEGKYRPLRSAQAVKKRFDDSQRDSTFNSLLEIISQTEQGAWISLNPLQQQITGKAPKDSDVTNLRYTLVEADDLSKEEQWSRIRKLNLPVKAVVWSGGKSLHVIVKIDAGQDRELYRKRVELLYCYLTRKKFPYDCANRNPSRLTRVPGIFRGDDMQYLVAEEFGPRSWDDFERQLPADMKKKPDRRALTSPVNGMLGGRPPMPITQLARQFAAENSLAEQYTLRCWRGTWWHYSDCAWKELPVQDLEMMVTGFLQRQKMEEQMRIGNNVINDIIANLRADELCGLPRHKYNMPCFLPDGESAEDFMSFRNGLAKLSPLWLFPDTPAELLPHTPRFFSRRDVDYDFLPEAECPEWNNYLETTFDTPEMRTALQMCFGYILSRKQCFNIGFFWIGRGGDGKSVAAHILRKLVGESNTCCLPFGDLGNRFSSWLLTEHTLNLVEELPVNGEQKNLADSEKIFKMVTDGAVIPAERKFQAPTDARAKARCVFLANELPTFLDRTDGLWDRLVVLQFTRRFRNTGDEKPGLKYQLEQELPGIFNWAITGMRQLSQHTRFPIPEAARELQKQHRLNCDHEAEFLSETLQEDPAGVLERQSIYRNYRLWMEEHGYRPVGQNRFNAAVQARFPEVRIGRIRSPRDLQVWFGIRYCACNIGGGDGGNTAVIQ